MEEPFEKYIRENRHALDNQEVPEGVWEGIQADRQKPKRRWMHVVKYAAAVLFISAASILTYDTLRQPKTETATQSTEEVQVPEEIQFIQISFEAENKEAESQFQATIPADHEMYMEIKSQLDMLENERQNLILEFSENYQDPRILEDIANVYRMKIEILEDAVRIIKSNP